MMKNYVIITLCGLVASGQSIHANADKRLVEAIENVNGQKVRKFLARNLVLPNELKKRYLGIAKNTVNECKNEVALDKSPWDALKVGVGMSLISYFGSNFYKNSGLKDMVKEEPDLFFKDRDEEEPGLTRVVAEGLLFLGVAYMAYKGYQCSSALARVAAAQEIKKSIELEKTQEEAAEKSKNS